ncbi:Uu.00g138270.m01.CDS01 [Anthostomella pinea]|uniref:Uu.00g138270.m01.CDS01 n=1 Tax=Anthostomella pinea TaxID=933095 RepID=A0AAI8VPM8_9PEZI|nr:Uu.00g138270.m01.CDS01 [Anthostomella pinea]
MASQELRVQPLGCQDAPPSERFELSDMDHTMIKVYVQIAEVFKLTGDVVQDAIVSSVKEGLEFSLSQFPLLAGFSPHGRVQWADPGNDFPSFAYLEQNDFPVQLLEGHKLLPKSVTEKQLFSPLGENADEDTIISAFQINFIRGGLILAAAIHHNCSDGTGCNGFLKTWAKSSAAARLGAPFEPIDRAALDRARLSAPRPSPARWKQLDG